MKACFLNFAKILAFIGFLSPLAYAENLPSPQEMEILKPAVGRRAQVFDDFFDGIATAAQEVHQTYTDPAVLSDLRERLERVRVSGSARDVLTKDEWLQFELNFEYMRNYEIQVFESPTIKASMATAIAFQKEWTSRRSPKPTKGVALREISLYLYDQAYDGNLYKAFRQELPSEVVGAVSAKTWGELMLMFNSDFKVRESIVSQFPELLPKLAKLMQAWAWDDTSVKSVSVYNSGTSLEFWVLERDSNSKIPNRFLLSMEKDLNGLMNLEFAPTVFFNRVTRITSNGDAVVYKLEAIEKGRTMELYYDPDLQKVVKRVLPGGEFFRKLKIDEFLQRQYVLNGVLNLFLGTRTLQFDQIQKLMATNPELMRAVGQFGFSVTGGRAQTVSSRTDTPEEQLAKVTATLIDIIEFARTTNVRKWLSKNGKFTSRAILAGVGSGGSQPLANPTSQKDCEGLMVK